MNAIALSDDRVLPLEHSIVVWPETARPSAAGTPRWRPPEQSMGFSENKMLRVVDRLRDKSILPVRSLERTQFPPRNDPAGTVHAARNTRNASCVHGRQFHDRRLHHFERQNVFEQGRAQLPACPHRKKCRDRRTTQQYLVAGDRDASGKRKGEQWPAVPTSRL